MYFHFAAVQQVTEAGNARANSVVLLEIEDGSSNEDVDNSHRSLSINDVAESTMFESRKPLKRRRVSSSDMSGSLLTAVDAKVMKPPIVVAQRCKGEVVTCTTDEERDFSSPSSCWPLLLPSQHHSLKYQPDSNQYYE